MSLWQLSNPVVVVVPEVVVVEDVAVGFVVEVVVNVVVETGEDVVVEGLVDVVGPVSVVVGLVSLQHLLLQQP